MKKLITVALSSTIALLSLNAARPNIMLLPDKQWCHDNGYTQRVVRNGKTKIEENYDEAFLNSTLKNLEVEFKSMMTEPSRGYPVLSYTEIMEKNDFDDDFGGLFEGSESGEGIKSAAFEDRIAASNYDPDIYVKVGWDEEVVGLDKTIVYRIDLIDAYNKKSFSAITGVVGPAPKNITPTVVCLRKGFNDKMDEIDSKMTSHFNDIQTNGREIMLDVRIISGSGLSLTQDYDGVNLTKIIKDWVEYNTVNHQNSPKQTTRNRMTFENVRVKVRDAAGKTQTAASWTAELQKYLKDNYNIKSEVISNGLGNAILALGEN